MCTRNRIYGYLMIFVVGVIPFSSQGQDRVQIAQFMSLVQTFNSDRTCPNPQTDLGKLQLLTLSKLLHRMELLGDAQTALLSDELAPADRSCLAQIVAALPRGLASSQLVLNTH